MKKIINLTLPKLVETPVKRVAAYTRVSAQGERLANSLDNQIGYYSDYIKAMPNWEYAGVYSDFGISGTGTKNRDGFNQMMRDCAGGKIDIILSKSISRFARNTIDLLETVRQLKEWGIEVRFEKENINSLSNEGELMLSIMASIAQEESISIANNVKWGIRKRFKEGIPHNHNKVLGYRWEGNTLVVDEAEAKVVRFIYDEYLAGKSAQDISKSLVGIAPKLGIKLSHSTIRGILGNITYTGNMLLQKGFTANTLVHDHTKNVGKLPSFYVADSHEAIIDQATFDAVQTEKARRKALGTGVFKGEATCCFSSKLICYECGKPYYHYRTKRDNYWRCHGKIDKTCKVRRNLQNYALDKACTEVIGEGYEERFLKLVDNITVTQDQVLTFNMKDGTTITKEAKATAMRAYWTPELKELKGKYLSLGGSKGTGLGFNAYVKEVKNAKGYSYTGNIKPDNIGTYNVSS